MRYCKVYVHVPVHLHVYTVHVHTCRAYVLEFAADVAQVVEQRLPLVGDDLGADARDLLERRLEAPLSLDEAKDHTQVTTSAA